MVVADPRRLDGAFSLSHVREFSPNLPYCAIGRCNLDVHARVLVVDLKGVRSMRFSFASFLLGWSLSIWLAVPKIIRTAGRTATTALVNGANAVVHTVAPHAPVLAADSVLLPKVAK